VSVSRSSVHSHSLELSFHFAISPLKQFKSPKASLSRASIVSLSFDSKKLKVEPSNSKYSLSVVQLKIPLNHEAVTFPVTSTSPPTLISPVTFISPETLTSSTNKLAILFARLPKNWKKPYFTSVIL